MLGLGLAQACPNSSSILYSEHFYFSSGISQASNHKITAILHVSVLVVSVSYYCLVVLYCVFLLFYKESLSVPAKYITYKQLHPNFHCFC